MRKPAATAQARSCAIEAAALERSREVNREIEQRAQIAEKLAAASCLSAVADLDRKLEMRAQIADQSAKAFATQVANDTRLQVSLANAEALIDIARAGEARAHAAEAAAKAHADVGLSALATSLAATSQSLQGKAKELGEAIQSIRVQVAKHEKRKPADRSLIQLPTTVGFAEPTYLFMASEVRSGSTYVAELISYSVNASFGFEVWGLNREELRDLTDQDTATDIRTLVSTLWLSRENIRSSKVMCSQLSILTRCARRDRAVQSLLFGENARWIIVRRRNRIRQAVSLATARKSGVYHSYARTAEPQLSVSMSDVEDALRAINLSDEYLRLFSSVPSVCAEIFYEDVLADPQGTIRAALEDVGVLPQSTRFILGEAKLSPDRQAQKADLELAFGDWLLENHHPTSPEM